MKVEDFKLLNGRSLNLIWRYNMKIDGIQCGKYQHSKTKKLYEVIGVALHTETREEMVVYKALYQCDEFPHNQIWVRPKKMFLENIIDDGCSIPRFKRIDE